MVHRAPAWAVRRVTVVSRSGTPGDGDPREIARSRVAPELLTSGPMRRLAALLVCSLFAGCPASHRHRVGSDADADSDSDTDADIDGGLDAGPDAGWNLDGGYYEDVWIDPGCADAGPPPTDYQCDLFDAASCGAGMACYPYIFYPEGDCAEEGYGSLCEVAGVGGEDDFCEGAQDCREGFACFQSGEGERCLQLCPLVGDSGCAPGRICAPTDVPDMGACF